MHHQLQQSQLWERRILKMMQTVFHLSISGTVMNVDLRVFGCLIVFRQQLSNAMVNYTMDTKCVDSLLSICKSTVVGSDLPRKPFPRLSLAVSRCINRSVHEATEDRTTLPFSQQRENFKHNLVLLESFSPSQNFARYIEQLYVKLPHEYSSILLSETSQAIWDLAKLRVTLDVSLSEYNLPRYLLRATIWSPVKDASRLALRSRLS